MLNKRTNEAESRGEHVSRRWLLSVTVAGTASALLGGFSADAQETAGGGAKRGEGIARTGLRYKGSRYKAGGNTPKGFDCSGFTQFVVDKVTGRDIGRTVTGQWRLGSPVAKGRWRAGDLVFFEDTFERGLSHVGIYVDNGRFVHAENERSGVVVSDIDSDYYASHYRGARRLV